MPLEEYRSKRHFGVTPEPSAVEGTAHGGGLMYVIQKHAASRLHYDFRIELGGVLLSWAVPKGPSLDPADKRLAMHVEDHPVAYGAFEGTIPKGEYGGGTVMLWDRGTWEPDHGDPMQHLADGHLKFTLHGERLRGRWMLVRTKGYGKSAAESWLLFKERDDEVRPRTEFDALDQWTTSVATGRTMEQIADNAEAVWHSDMSVEENVATSAMPRDVQVSLATLVDEPPAGSEWIHEIKFDGYRIVAYLDRGSVRLMSRNGKDWTDRFPEVAAHVAQMRAKQAVLDGEVVALRPDGRADFQALQNHAKSGEAAQLAYMVFDLVYVDGHDLTQLPLLERKHRLKDLIADQTASIMRYADHVEGRGREFFAHACNVELEGIMSKRADAPYRGGRSRSWLKVKCLLRQEFAIVGWTDPGGVRKAFGALVLGVRQDDEGPLRYVGRVGTGFDDATLEDILARLKPLSVEVPPVANPPAGTAGRSIHWVRPELVAEVAFAEWTQDGSLRHPSFKGIREDKGAAEVKVELPLGTDDVLSAEEPQPDADRPRDGSAEGDAPRTRSAVRLTNPARLLWPDVPFTKIELAQYYEAVAEHMLPHVKDRPLSLVRCPSGYTGECFYQKHIENFPDSVSTVGIYEPQEDKTEPYATVNDAAGLVGLAQMGVLEIHPWGSLNSDPDVADRLIFDLDPDADMAFGQVAATAMLLRSELSRIGLDSWLKTTGGKGLHVVVPVSPEHDWNTAKGFSAGFVERIVSIEPKMFTSNMSMAKRQGRIYIDYLRNARGATAIAPYSTRARPGAPVAVPLDWVEIEGGAKPSFDVFTVRQRLDALPVDPWASMLACRQKLTSQMLTKVDIDAGRESRSQTG